MPAVALLACALISLSQRCGYGWPTIDIHAETLESIESGVRLEPGNADAWDELGRFRQLDFNSGDPGRIARAYKRAVESKSTFG